MLRGCAMTRTCPRPYASAAMRAIPPSPGLTRQSIHSCAPRHRACPQNVVSSNPPTTSRSGCEQQAISRRPETVLWSVRARKSNPRSRATWISSGTLSWASEWVVCVCRSPRYQPGPRSTGAESAQSVLGEAACGLCPSASMPETWRSYRQGCPAITICVSTCTTHSPGASTPGQYPGVASNAPMCTRWVCPPRCPAPRKPLGSKRVSVSRLSTPPTRWGVKEKQMWIWLQFGGTVNACGRCCLQSESSSSPWNRYRSLACKDILRTSACGQRSPPTVKRPSSPVQAHRRAQWTLILV